MEFLENFLDEKKIPHFFFRSYISVSFDRPRLTIASRRVSRVRVSVSKQRIQVTIKKNLKK